MDRLTGKQVKSLAEAYAQVYIRPEEQVEVLNEMGQPGGNLPGGRRPTAAQPPKRMTDAEFDKKYADVINAPRSANDREGLGPRQQVQPPQRTGAPAAQTVAATGGAGGRVTVGKSYAATLGGQKGSVTYDAQGNRKFTPATQPAAAAAPAVGGSPAPAKTTAPSGTTTTATTAPAAPAKPANPLMKDMPGQNRAELEKLRADAAMKSIGQSPRAKQILGGTARSAAANQIGRQTLNRSINADIQQANRPEVLNRPAPAASSPTNNTATAFAPGTNLAPGANKISSTPVSKLKSDAQNKKTVMNSVDLFDIVKGHLMSEGATEEEALRLMVIMPQEEVESIVEAPGEWFGGIRDKARASRSAQMQSSQPTPKPLPSVASPFAKPASKDDSGKLTTYGAGGGVEAERRGQTRAQVMQQGAKNLENKKRTHPVNQGPDFGR